ncbi:hypothetical protein ACFZAU_10760 [Streptomyces sp. NPDC008238]
MDDENQRQRLRRVGIAAFASASAVTLAFFAFFPGLPHVVDWGAVLVALGLGAGARHVARAWVRKREARADGTVG